MPRTLGRPCEFLCMTCQSTRRGMWWRGDEFSNATDWNVRELQRGCGNPDCADPQLTKRIAGGYLGFSQVREAQRAVVYFFPDGDYASPHTNDPGDEQAVICRQMGGVRMEFPHIQDLVSFQRERALKALEKYEREIDEGKYEDSGLTPNFKELRDSIYESGRNQVIEYDESSLKENKHRVTEYIEMQRERRAKLQETLKHLQSSDGPFRARIGGPEDNKRYERLRGNRR